MTAQQDPHIRLSRECSAPPEAVYDLLADLRSHLDWAGARQSGDFRLLSMDAAPGPATAGTRFSTTGAIPMSPRRWHDESVVTVADRPRAYEFLTSATSGSMVASYRHRYDIVPAAAGCRVTYSMTQERIERPVLRLGLPVMRSMTWRFAIPMFAGRGFRNLLTAAESRASSKTPAEAAVAGAPR